MPLQVETFSEWVKNEIEWRQTTQRGFADYLTDILKAQTGDPESKVTYTSIQNWVKGEVGSLKPDSIQAIAICRGETYSQTVAWLQGEAIVPFDEDPAISLLRKASRPVLIQALRIIWSELDLREKQEMATYSLMEIVWKAIRGKGGDPRLQTSIDEFCKYSIYPNQGKLDRLLKLIYDEIPPDYDDLVELARTLTEYTKTKYTAEDLANCWQGE